MAPGDRDKLLGSLGPTSGRSVGGVNHTCVKTLERQGCPGCLDDALARTMGGKRNPRPAYGQPSSHSCITTRDRENCEGCAYDDLRRARGELVKPQPMQPFPNGGALKVENLQIGELHGIPPVSAPRTETGYREQTCYACGQALRSSPRAADKVSPDEMVRVIALMGALACGVSACFSLCVASAEVATVAICLAVVLFGIAVAKPSR